MAKTASVEAKPVAETKAVDVKANGVAEPVAIEPTRTIKVNGKEVKLTEAQLIAAAQKGFFADQKLKSVDVIAKNAQGLLDSIKNPAQFLNLLKTSAKELGVEPKTYLREL